MADDNLARSRNDGPDFFAEDDPLAELARIVGYDERLVPRSPVTERREPAFNLEDELLREFERYDSPRSRLPADSFAPSVDEAVVSSPMEAVEPEELDWIAANDQRQPEEQFFEEAVLADTLPEPDTDAPGRLDDTPDVEGATEFDLADELELALGEAPFRAAEPAPAEPQAQPVRRGGYTPGFRMPLANFNIARDLGSDPSARGEVSPAAAVTPPKEEAVAVPSVDVFSRDDLAPASGHELAIPADLSDLDALIGDASRHSMANAARDTAIPSVGDGHEKWAEAVTRRQAAATASAGSDVAGFDIATSSSRAVEPALTDEFVVDDFELALDDLDFDLSDLMLDDEQPLFAEPRPATASVSPSAVASPSQPVFAPQPAVLPVTPQPVAQAVTQPIPQAVAAPAPIQHTASWSPIARAAPQPLATEPVATTAPVRSVAETVAPALAQLDDLPFDASMITDGEDQPEPVAHLDVPDLHIEEDEPVAPQRNDYDFDLDGELSALLRASPALEAEADEPVPVSAVEGAAQQTPPPAAYPDLDDFERALEEDFRRSLTAPLAPQPQPSYADVMTPATGRIPARERLSLPSISLPLAIAGVVLIGGSIGYAFLSGDDSTVAGNGGPIVIAADTDPVKVLPENPGGKTVPNQDKAVYDRVAGAAMEAPKQETLISTSEEPVDVVQKTLMTDSLPLEGQDIAAAEDADAGGLMQDDRLLPDEAEALPSEAGQQTVAVMPRRVKTMIVRPDGTLVEQEVLAEPATVAEPARSPETDKLPAASVKTVEVAAVPDAPVAAQPQANAAGVAGIVPVSTGVADTAPVAAEITDDAPAMSGMAAPVPTARPAEQPVNVVAAVSDRGNLRPTQEQPAAAPAPATEVAAVAPGGYVIQIASLPSEADAQKSYQNLSSKFGSVIGGRGVDIKKAEIAGKGTFYRVRIPAGSKADAVSLCESYRAAGGSCLVAQ